MMEDSFVVSSGDNFLWLTFSESPRIAYLLLQLECVSWWAELKTLYLISDKYIDYTLVAKKILSNY